MKKKEIEESCAGIFSRYHARYAEHLRLFQFELEQSYLAFREEVDGLKERVGGPQEQEYVELCVVRMRDDFVARHHQKMN
ncbi:MAG: hypothetical protein ACFB11_00695 [Paracoccaceae bacterium]